jgi:hypothetical protein
MTIIPLINDNSEYNDNDDNKKNANHCTKDRSNIVSTFNPSWSKNLVNSWPPTMY